MLGEWQKGFVFFDFGGSEVGGEGVPEPLAVVIVEVEVDAGGFPFRIGGHGAIGPGFQARESECGAHEMGHYGGIVGRVEDDGGIPRGGSCHVARGFFYSSEELVETVHLLGVDFHHAIMLALAAVVAISLFTATVPMYLGIRSVNHLEF